jgi:hypothetical protein
MKISRAVVATVAAVLMLGFTVGQAAAAEAPPAEGDVVVCIVGLGNDDN